jgi:3-isopropylmalate/(R)-2-methylmalate dehydratase small subunit
MQLVEADPAARLRVDVRESSVGAGAERIAGTMPSAARDALLTGAWDATGLLLAADADVRRVAERLPYLNDFRTIEAR